MSDTFPEAQRTALAAWLDTQDLPGAGEPLEVGFISGGSQNEIFEIRRGELHAALRKPPTTAPAPRDEGILREWRIIEALDGTDVPHTAAIGVCEDASVLGRPFYLMGFVDGWSPMNTRGWPPPFDRDAEARPGLAFELINGIVAMGRVDWQARGLGDLGRPEGYHDRQVERWTRFYQRIAGREIPGLDTATRWLAEHRPIDFVPGLMHGDYQFANVMFHHGAPARLAAIVDWEMGTIGDPKIDLAWALQGWPEDTGGGSSSIGYVDITGMPGHSELLHHYASSSGRQVDDFDYYLVLARWKLAIVLEQGYQRAADDPKLESFGPIVLDLMARAAELASSSKFAAVC
ncbi:MAG TPA: phosphotransferase family protein [Acidimicrobiales bacterium]|nr:phosphotransferase family protein [Acidimicrobiales bacterium]